MISINSYLHFMGKAEEAMNFYKSVLGGQFTGFQRYKDMAGGNKIPAGDQEKMIHIALQIKENITIMATDVMTAMESPVVCGNNYHICIQAEDRTEADRIFQGLSAAGKVEMPMSETFWGAYFGMCRDRFEVQWMINCEPKQ